MVFRAPVRQPVQTSFGSMHDRPAVLVRIEDRDGLVGWGEIWCNFPSVGAEHRARLFESCVAPVLLERDWSSPQEAFTALSRRLHILAIQCGEPGTVAQAIAGADIALWDLAAKQRREPLWRYLGGAAQVRVYASGLNPDALENLAAAKRDEGYRAFKLKVGFGADRDAANLRALREVAGPHADVMVDANQAWTAHEAVAMSRRLAEHRPFWLEEPICADRSLGEWLEVARGSPIPLACGENLRGEEAFAAAIDGGAIAVLQPDLGKWGGFSGCLPVARNIRAANKLFCPHWLGGGIGLAASLHLKAGAGGPGYVEVDANPNPLRESLATPQAAMAEGVITLSDRPGLGVTPDLDATKAFRVPH